MERRIRSAWRLNRMPRCSPKTGRWRAVSRSTPPRKFTAPPASRLGALFSCELNLPAAPSYVTCRSDPITFSSGVALPPGCIVVSNGPGHHLKARGHGGLKEPAAAHLLDLAEATAELKDTPELGVVVLLRAR